MWGILRWFWTGKPSGVVYRWPDDTYPSSVSYERVRHAVTYDQPKHTAAYTSVKHRVTFDG